MHFGLKGLKTALREPQTTLTCLAAVHSALSRNRPPRGRSEGLCSEEALAEAPAVLTAKDGVDAGQQQIELDRRNPARAIFKKRPQRGRNNWKTGLKRMAQYSAPAATALLCCVLHSLLLHPARNGHHTASGRDSRAANSCRHSPCRSSRNSHNTYPEAGQRASGTGPKSNWSSQKATDRTAPKGRQRVYCSQSGDRRNCRRGSNHRRAKSPDADSGCTASS